MNRGPLSGVRVVEFSALGPVPFCAMLLADMGADIVQIVRPGSTIDAANFMQRGRRFVPLDLKNDDDRRQALDLIRSADILVEGNRPGVMEKLGLGPAECHKDNSPLVYGRMTGWGQTGSLASTAGHDINFIALTGVLDAIGASGEAPVPPLNLVGDYGGGAMFLAFGLLSALLEARATGQGRVVDAAMVDGSAMLMSLFCRMLSQGQWGVGRGQHMLDGGAPWYTTYRTSDDRYVAVGALEEPFWQALLAGLEIAPQDLPSRQDKNAWPVIRSVLGDAFSLRARDDWAAHFQNSDACVTPVLSLEEAAQHPHIAERGTYVTKRGVIQPGAAPRMDRALDSVDVDPTFSTIDAIFEKWL